MKTLEILILVFLTQLRCVKSGIWYYEEEEIDPVTGMTRTEKSYIKSAWKYMMKDPTRYGSMILQRYFEKYPQYLSYYPFKDGLPEELENQKDFKVYLNLMMYTLDSIIDNLETNPTVMRDILMKLGKNHFKNNIKVEPFWSLRDTILDIIQPMLNTKMYNAWEKYLNVSTAYITSSMKEPKNSFNSSSTHDIL